MIAGRAGSILSASENTKLFSRGRASIEGNGESFQLLLRYGERQGRPRSGGIGSSQYTDCRTTIGSANQSFHGHLTHYDTTVFPGRPGASQCGVQGQRSNSNGQTCLLIQVLKRLHSAHAEETDNPDEIHRCMSCVTRMNRPA